MSPPDELKISGLATAIAFGTGDVGRKESFITTPGNTELG
jgi:hypothetical protein